MNKFFYIAKAIILGLLTTQVLATLHVYLSNTELHRTISVISEAGYLAVPNHRIAHSLQDFGPAFFGGVFFTLSIGAGLSVVSVVLAWTWGRIMSRNKAFFVSIVVLWISVIGMMNSQGFVPMVTSYFLIIPLVTFSTTLKWMCAEPSQRVWLHRLVPFLPLVLLTIIWAVHADRFLFLDIRDYLLLSNPVGKKVDSFYYRYTLYPAQAFKPLAHKTLKTCSVKGIKDKATCCRVENVLANYEYLPVAGADLVDLEVVAEKGVLNFNRDGNKILETTVREFCTQPLKILQTFSTTTDRHGPFRQATFLSLLVGFPVILYVTTFGLLHFVLQFFLGSRRSSVIASVLSFLIGLALLAPLRIGASKAIRSAELSEALASKHWEQRVSVLRTVVDKGLEVAKYPAYQASLTSPHVPERYWLAKAFGLSDNPETYTHLIGLLDDPHPNVVSMAFCALGQRGNKAAIGKILETLKTSDHWYNQWYAYRALKSLGWRQRKQQGNTSTINAK